MREASDLKKTQTETQPTTTRQSFQSRRATLAASPRAISPSSPHPSSQRARLSVPTL